MYVMCMLCVCYVYIRYLVVHSFVHSCVGSYVVYQGNSPLLVHINIKYKSVFMVNSLYRQYINRHFKNLLRIL